MILLDTSETLKKILLFLPSEHPLRSLAMELAPLNNSGYAGADSSAERILASNQAFWPGGVGILGGQEFQDKPQRAILFWLEESIRQDQQDQTNPSGSRQLVLNIAPGRYRVEYWGADSRGPMGVEIATGPTLVLGPPKAERLVAFLRRA
jgi:hypothetical protein